MRIAFFDLDKTLIGKNSAGLWVRSELRDGHISKRTALRAIGWIIQYRLGFAAMDHAVRRGIALLAGLDEAVLAERTRVFYRAEVASLYRPGGLQALHAHRDAGDSLVLLTTSSAYLSAEVSRDVDLDDYLCSHFETDADGRFTGRAVEPLCYGPGKVTAASAYAQAHGADLRDCAFYSDSASDLPMLEAVGRPVVVDPDPRLRRVARRRGWEIADWGEASVA